MVDALSARDVPKSRLVSVPSPLPFITALLRRIGLLSIIEIIADA